jgi:shikimate kinase
LDLFHAGRIVRCRAIFAELYCTSLDSVIGIVDIVVEEGGGTVGLCGDAVILSEGFLRVYVVEIRTE